MAERIIRNYALPISEFDATLKCRECEVFIGTGHEDAEPLPAPDGVGFLCRSCLASWQRRNRDTPFMTVQWSTT